MAAAISKVSERPRGAWTRSKAAAVRYRADVEGQAVRTAMGVALVIVCLGLTGCSLFGKRQTAQNGKNKPFLGASEPANKAETAAMPRDSGGPLPKESGLLAGQILVESTGRPAKAFVLVKNLEDDDAKTAKLDVETKDGYFTIPGLKVGQQYELIARAEEDGELISGKWWGKPPAATLLIRLDKRFTNANTPPLPNAPKVPGKKGVTSTESAQERTPAVSIEPPVKLPDREPPTQGSIAGPPPVTGSGTNSSGNSPNPANIADGGFRKISQPQTETINIPNPPPVPRQPQWENVPGQPQPTRSVPGPGSVRLPNLPTTVPSCGLYGNILDNFALYDLDGKVWEYKRDRRGRLMLLDFWYHTCSACLQEIHDLVELQRNFGAYGLEVVGIACETGSLEEQQRNVRAIRGRYGINYTTLLSGGGPEHCPVVAQFQVGRYPTLVLIDADGKIIWRNPKTGMDKNENYRLKKIIHTYLVAQQAPP
ncbi:MAG: TlpA family protein disulfide reductase [Gemmataceae bacterium]